MLSGALSIYLTTNSKDERTQTYRIIAKALRILTKKGYFTASPYCMNKVLNWIIAALVVVVLIFFGYVRYDSDGHINIFKPKANILVMDGSGSLTGDELTGGLLGDFTGTVLTGDNYSGTDAQVKSQLLDLLAADTTLSKQFARSSIDVESGDSISINKDTLRRLVTEPTVTLQGRATAGVTSITVIAFDAQNKPYMTAKLTGYRQGMQTWSLPLSPNANNIKVGNNAYLVIATLVDKTYVSDAVAVQVDDNANFDKEWTKRCLLDVCTDQSIAPFMSGAIRIQENAKTRIEFQDNTYISVMSTCDVGQKTTTVTKIKQGLVKTIFPCDGTTLVQQSIYNDQGAQLQTFPDLTIVPTLAIGNISYTKPTLTFTVDNTTEPIHIDALQGSLETIRSYIFQQGYVRNDLVVELPQGLFVKYTLDASKFAGGTASAVTPLSTTADAYKLIPKLDSAMSDNRLYPILSDTTKQDIIAAYDGEGAFSISKSCKPKAGTISPEVEFGIYPVNMDYDMVLLYNCRTYNQ